MAQVKVFGLRSELQDIRQELSETIHSCVVDALGFPSEKRFHRFFPLDREDFLFPPDRSDRYTIIEISMFEGRSQESKGTLIRMLYERIGRDIGIPAQDLEITLFESPMQNWGIRGMVGDELNLTYRVDV
ncbi:MAG: tautomerase family protein [Dehalococcoidia bacterium]|nr:tautomerase family protein [Dehalococcoidia bacterium]